MHHIKNHSHHTLLNCISIQQKLLINDYPLLQIRQLKWPLLRKGPAHSPIMLLPKAPKQQCRHSHGQSRRWTISMKNTAHKSEKYHWRRPTPIRTRKLFANTKQWNDFPGPMKDAASTHDTTLMIMLQILICYFKTYLVISSAFLETYSEKKARVQDLQPQSYLKSTVQWHDGLEER